MSNPLLESHALPLFSAIKAEHIEPAIDTILQNNRAALQILLNQNGVLNWDNLIIPLNELEDALDKAWSPVRHLNSVLNSPELRSAYDNCVIKISEYHTELGQNAKLFNAIKKLAAQNDTLNSIQQKVLDDAILSFKLSGVDLPATDQQRFKTIQSELSALSSKFEQNVLDATDAWTQLHATMDKLQGLPESALAIAKQAATDADQQGWLLTLQIPCYIAVMTYADNRELREEMYQAYNTRASDQGPHAGQWNNDNVIEKILALRHEAAQLLGFPNYAEKSLATKMAETPAEVTQFLNDLAKRAYPLAQEEINELAQFAAEALAGDVLQPWDIAYFSEKLRNERYQLSQEMLKPWFPAEQVINGLFQIVQRLYGITIAEEKGIDTWHTDVQFYSIHDQGGQQRGQFYLDLYARPNKRGGAWMDECVNRFKRSESVQNPVAYLTCNFSPPIAGQPALLTHDEVVTLFHEFGHGLHHMLTQVDYPDVAGINGVEWDAVELPSQFMENWCWEQSALDLISSHHETQQALPKEMIEKLKQARNYHSAMQLVRQLEFSLFDFILHSEYDPQRGANTQAVLNRVREQVAVVRPPAYVKFQNGFSHIFGGGYAAGYYSYKWAEVLSADAFSLFEEKGIFDKSTGQAFLQNILERGGSQKAMDLFVAFRGRKPTIDALLRHSGLAA